MLVLKKLSLLLKITVYFQVYGVLLESQNHLDRTLGLNPCWSQRKHFERFTVDWPCFSFSSDRQLLLFGFQFPKQLSHPFYKITKTFKQTLIHAFKTTCHRLIPPLNKRIKSTRKLFISFSLTDFYMWHPSVWDSVMTELSRGGNPSSLYPSPLPQVGQRWLKHTLAVSDRLPTATSPWQVSQSHTEESRLILTRRPLLSKNNKIPQIGRASWRERV